jgi:hypothetical protein
MVLERNYFMRRAASLCVEQGFARLPRATPSKVCQMLSRLPDRFDQRAHARDTLAQFHYRSANDRRRQQPQGSRDRDPSFIAPVVLPLRRSISRRRCSSLNRNNRPLASEFRRRVAGNPFDASRGDPQTHIPIACPRIR